MTTKSNLTTENNWGTICVHDEAGGVWWPSDEADVEIEASEDPEATALRICREQPMRGTWKS